MNLFSFVLDNKIYCYTFAVVSDVNVIGIQWLYEVLACTYIYVCYVVCTCRPIFLRIYNLK